MQLDRWEQYKRLRALNPKTDSWLQNDPERRDRYLRLRELGLKPSSARKYTSPNFRSVGDEMLAKGRRSGMAYSIVLPDYAKADESIERKVYIGIGLLGEHKIRALGDRKESLEAELIGEAREVQARGGDVDKFIENRLNSFRQEARALRTQVPIEGTVMSERGEQKFELPAHSEPPQIEGEEMLERFEEYAKQVIDQYGHSVSEEVKNIILGKALSPVKGVIAQGVTEPEKLAALMPDVKEIIMGELSKLKESTRADNPTMYYLKSTRTDKFPYRMIEGKANFVQLMVIAAKAAAAHRKPKPVSLREAIKVLDGAGFRVAEVKA